MTRLTSGLTLALSLLLIGQAWPDSPDGVRGSDPALHSLPEANAFLEGMAERQRQHEEAVNRYAYDILEIEEHLDKNGTIGKVKSRSYEVFYVQGRPVKRQVAEDGIPFSPPRLAKEDGRVRKEVNEIVEQKAAGKSDDVTLSEILARHDFRSVAREEIAGRPTVVMDFAPRPGKPDLKGDDVLRSLAGRIWVDEEEREVVRVDIRNTQGIKLAFGLGASLAELDLTTHFQKVDDVWLPHRVEAHVAGRIRLVKDFRVHTSETYSRYRRYQVDSEERIDLGGAADPFFRSRSF
jgi:hypothetical protein